MNDMDYRRIVAIMFFCEHRATDITRLQACRISTPAEVGTLMYYHDICGGGRISSHIYYILPDQKHILHLILTVRESKNGFI